MKRIALLLFASSTIFAAPLTPQIVTTRIPILPAAQLEVPSAMGSSCTIEQAECVTSPGYSGTFNDTHEGAHLLSGRCLRRAFEYSLFCGNHKGTKTVATFTWENGKKIESSHVATGQKCTISQQVCTVYPWMVGTFTDGYEYGDSQNESTRCVNRARDYSIACANPVGAVTTATLLEPNGNTTSFGYVSKGTNCKILQSYCKNNPVFVGLFVDNFANVNESAPRCLARAKEYADWCGNKQGMQTTALFTRADNSTVETTYFVP